MLLTSNSAMHFSKFNHVYSDLFRLKRETVHMSKHGPKAHRFVLVGSFDDFVLVAVDMELLESCDFINPVFIKCTPRVNPSTCRIDSSIKNVPPDFAVFSE